jgi:AraC-like DNA-binding protein
MAVLPMQSNHGVRNLVKTGGLWKPMKRYFPHQHDWWELVFYTHGQGTLVAGPHRLPFKPGTVICVPPGMQHYEDSVDGYMNRWVAVERLSTRIALPNFTIDAQHPVFDLINILNAETYLTRPMSQAIVRNLFSTFTLYLQEWLASDDDEMLVELVKRRIIEGMTDPGFRVAEAMEGTGMSTDHLRRLFSQSMGVTPKKFLIDLRMTHASNLIQTGMAIKDAAEAVGMPDPYHFSRLFRQTMGKSPSSFRPS